MLGLTEYLKIVYKIAVFEEKNHISQCNDLRRSNLVIQLVDSVCIV